MAAFLAGDVMPAIAASFRVSTDPAEVGLGGFSYGGVATLQTVLSNPQLFGKALIESPSLQVGNGRLLRDAADAATLPDRVYIGMGGEESAIPPGAPPAIRERIARINAGLVVGARRLRDRLATALTAPTVKLVIDPAAQDSVADPASPRPCAAISASRRAAGPRSAWWRSNASASAPSVRSSPSMPPDRANGTW